MAGRRKNGTGTIRERKDGRWEGRIIIGSDDNGKVKTKSVFGATKTECTKKLKELQGDTYHITGRLPTQAKSSMSFGEWIDLWYRHYCKQTIRETTRTSYENRIYQHIIPEIGSIALDKLTQNDLQDFYTRLKVSGRLQYEDQQGKGLSDRMVRGCHASCRMALEKAVKEGLITMNPAIGCMLPPKKAREMQVLTHDEMQRFLIQAKHDGYYEIFLLDLSTGLRRGELMGLQWKDLNMTTGELRIERQVSRVNGELKTFPPKTKSSIRTIVLPPSVLKMLKAYQPSTNGSKWIFPSPVKTEDSPRDPHTVYSKMQLVLQRAECKRIRFHDLRHTFATMALEHGMDVKTLSAMIGHVSSATTLDIYSHITTEMEINAAQKIDKGIGRANTAIKETDVPKPEKRERTMTDFKPKQGKIRKSGSGGIYQISDNLWEGRFTPTNAQGKREAHNVYAKTREECEQLLDEMIVEVRQQIQAEKEQMKGMSL